MSAGGTRLALLNSAGVLDLTHNWFKPGYRGSHGTVTGTINDAGTSITGSSPGFVNEASQDFALEFDSGAVNAGTAQHPDTLPGNPLDLEYAKHRRFRDRMSINVIDVGAFEYEGLQIPVEEIPTAKRGRSFVTSLTATGGSGSYTWSVSSGSLPPGIRLDQATGLLWGKAVIRGSWNFTIRAEDSQNPSQFTEKDLTLNIELF